jgi:hypothetical protein
MQRTQGHARVAGHVKRRHGPATLARKAAQFRHRLAIKDLRESASLAEKKSRGGTASAIGNRLQKKQSHGSKHRKQSARRAKKRSIMATARARVAAREFGRTTRKDRGEIAEKAKKKSRMATATERIAARGLGHTTKDRSEPVRKSKRSAVSNARAPGHSSENVQGHVNDREDVDASQDEVDDGGKSDHDEEADPSSTEDVSPHTHAAEVGGKHVEKFHESLVSLVQEVSNKIDGALKRSADKALQESKKYEEDVVELRKGLQGFKSNTDKLKDDLSSEHSTRVKAIDQAIRQNLASAVDASDADDDSSSSSSSSSDAGTSRDEATSYDSGASDEAALVDLGPPGGRVGLPYTMAALPGASGMQLSRPPFALPEEMASQAATAGWGGSANMDIEEDDGPLLGSEHGI